MLAAALSGIRCGALATPGKDHRLTISSRAPQGTHARYRATHQRRRAAHDDVAQLQPSRSQGPGSLKLLRPLQTPISPLSAPTRLAAHGKQAHSKCFRRLRPRSRHQTGKEGLSLRFRGQLFCDPSAPPPLGILRVSRGCSSPVSRIVLALGKRVPTACYPCGHGERGGPR